MSAVCLGAVLFGQGMHHAVETVQLTSVVDSSVNAGDELGKVALDCYCDTFCETPGSYVDHITGKTIVVPYGKCVVNKAYARSEKKQGYPGCMGIDYKMAVMVDGDWVVSCEQTQGGYDCAHFPCKNAGFCIDA